MKKIPSLPDRSPSASMKAIWNEESETRRSRRKRHGRKDRNQRGSSKDFRKKRSLARSLVTPSFKPSGSSSRSRSMSYYSDRERRHARRKRKKLEKICPVKHRFKRAVDCCTYCFADTSTKYDWSVSRYFAKMARWMTAQMKPHIFDPISIVVFLKTFKLACHTNIVREGATMWLFYFFINKTAFAVPSRRLIAEHTDKKHSRSGSGKTGYLATYPQVRNFLLKKYATDEVIAKPEFTITPFAQTSCMIPSQ